MSIYSFSASRRSSGFTLVEALVALFISGLLASFAMRIYVSQNEIAITQNNVSAVQQNVRAALSEVSRRLLNAGAAIPEGIVPLESANSNPDSLTVRYSQFGGSVAVGEQTQVLQTAPIHVDTSVDLSQFSAGQAVYLWYSAPQVGQWFTITSIINGGAGWQEIHHQNDILDFEPKPGDMIVAMEEATYFIDATDPEHPQFMLALNGSPPQVYADNITDFQIRFVRNQGDTVDVINAQDTVVAAQATLAGLTEEADKEAPQYGDGGRRRRALSTEVFIRNRRQ